MEPTYRQRLDDLLDETCEAIQQGEELIKDLEAFLDYLEREIEELERE